MRIRVLKRWMVLSSWLAIAACQPPAPVETAAEAPPQPGSAVIVQGMYDAFAVGDVGAVTAVMAPDIVWNEAENFPYADGNPYVGPEAVVEGVFARLGGEWEYWRLSLEEVIESGERVVVTGRYEALNKATGKSIDAQFVHIWRVVDGTVTRFQQYADTAQVQAAMAAD